MVRSTLLGVALLVSTSLTVQAQSDRSGGWGTDRQSGYGQNVQGMSTADLQRALRRAGYDPGSMDGEMGPGTRAAIRAFQRDNGMEPTGEPSPRLMSMLEQADTRGARAGGYGESRSSGMDEGSNRETIADIQFALRDKGYQIRDINGELDQETRSAIRAYQRDNGMSVTGDPSTRLLASIQGRPGEPDSRQADRDGRRGGEDYSAGELVERTERLLQQKGYRVGPVDEQLDQQTAQAIAQYQQQRGMQPTGQPSRQLLADLESSDTTAQATPDDMARGIVRDLGRVFGGQGQQQPQQGSPR